MGGIFRQMLTHAGRHREPQVGVNIDFAHRHLRRLTQHIFRNTDSIRHLAAELVDHGHIFGHHRRRAVQDDGEPGQPVHDFLQDIKAQLRFLAGFKFESAMAGANGNGQRIDAGAVYKILNLVRVSIIGLVGFHADFVFHAGELTQFAFNGDAACMCIIHHFFGNRHVFLIIEMGTVDHNGGKAAVNALLAQLKAGAVIKMQRNRQAGFFHRRLYHMIQIAVMRVFAGRTRNLQNNRGIQFLAGFHNALHNFHIVHVERADRITAVIRLFKHVLCVYEWHNKTS